MSQLSTHREFQFENEYVRVWKTIITSQVPLNFHRHDHPRVIVALKGGVLIKVNDRGEKTKLVLEPGKAYWYEDDPSEELHADINLSTDPVELMVIEMR